MRPTSATNSRCRAVLNLLFSSAFLLNIRRMTETSQTAKSKAPTEPAAEESIASNNPDAKKARQKKPIFDACHGT